MNAPERHELFVLEDGEKPCVNDLTSNPTKPTSTTRTVSRSQRTPKSPTQPQ